ncbi:S1C family serine protease [Nocardia lasii]|uniref:S1C family serine protease n=1 Tax=Nocardia lasii TaxID=1616107 RepID=A0ABW1JVX6_9NOCA
MKSVGRLLVVALLGLGAFLGFRSEYALVEPQFVAQAQAPVLVPLDPVAVAGQLEPVLVNIDAASAGSGVGAAGSGIVLTPDGQILTSHHVIKGAEKLRVTDIANGLEYEASVLGYDAAADIALLSLGGASGLPVAWIGSSSDLRIGQDVLAIGDAGGDGGDPTAVSGPVTDLDATIVAMNAADLSRKALHGMVEIAAPVVGGQSGGALVDGSGAVVGVIAAASGQEARAEGKPANGYAVPIDTVMRIVEQIRSGTPTETVHIGPTATLGVQVIDGRPAGAQVSWAFFGQPAREAGINIGDVITSVDGVSITTAKALGAAISVRKPADLVRLEVTSPDGERRTVEAVLATGTPS